MTYTVVCSYGATGEGQTLMLWVGYAPDEATALESFNRAYDPYFGQGATITKGLDLDQPGLNDLLGHTSRAYIERMAESRCNWHYTASYHINCS